MSHYHAEVWVPWDLESAASKFVESVLAPYKENSDGEGWWDWYQIGGRYTGIHDPSYDPEKDKCNIEANGEIKWPTKWARFAGDIMEIKDLPESLTCYTLMAQGQVFQHEIWDGDNFIDGDFNGLVVPKLKELGIARGHLVTIDYHS